MRASRDNPGRTEAEVFAEVGALVAVLEHVYGLQLQSIVLAPEFRPTAP